MSLKQYLNMKSHMRDQEIVFSEAKTAANRG